MGPEIAFVVCVITPVALVGVPLLRAHRKARRARLAALRTAPTERRPPAEG